MKRDRVARIIRWQIAGLAVLLLAGLLALSAAPLAAQPSPLPTPTAIVIEVRQPPAPPQGFLEKYGVIALVVTSVVGGALALIFNHLLGPIVAAWGEKLRDALKGEGGRFRERYIPALAEAHQYLKLVGIHGREGVPPPLLREVYVSLHMSGGERLGSARDVSIAQAFDEHTRLLILGEPGAGKSTLLDWLALVFTGQIPPPLSLPRKRGRVARSAGWGQAGKLVPVFMPLRKCVADERPLHELMADPALLPLALTPPQGFFTGALERNRCLVLLDGLDEVIDERQRERAARKINALVCAYPGNRYVVTCRVAGWKEGALTGEFARLYVRDFDDGEIVRFVRSWYRAVRTRQVALRGDLSREARQQETARAEQRAQDEAARLLQSLRRNHSLYLLARNPLILSLIALVHYRRTKLPQGRARLYQECLEILLDVWDSEDKALEIAGPSLKAKETILRAIACDLHVRGLTEAGREELETLIAPLLPGLDCPTDAAETLRQIEERSGVLISRGIERYAFAHRTLQEYLVARVLVEAPDKAAALWGHLRDEPWREIILLYSGLIPDATALVEGLLAQPDDGDYHTLILAGECLAEDVHVAPAARARAVAGLEAAFRSTSDTLALARLSETLAALSGADVVALLEQALSAGELPRRLMALRALAARGRADPAAVDALRRARQAAPGAVQAAALWALLGLGVDDEEMIKIPAGEFLMGGDKAKDKQAHDDEPPQHRLTLPEYWIARYPVSVAQFAAFVEATGYKTTAEEQGSGYTWSGSEWKDVKGADWRRPRGPGSDASGKENHPVTLVSWDDAAAFCKWASGLAGFAVRLPTEAEWEKAARGGLPSPAGGRGAGGEGRIYPWGDEPPTAELCNFAMNVKDTTPVGKYSPQGDSPYGCADMAGNVWEWTSSLFKGYPYRGDDGREDPDSRGARVLRGGSFYNARRSVRCAYRNRNDPNNRSGSVGFRVCASPIVTSEL